jgi:hypothetical protein
MHADTQQWQQQDWRLGINAVAFWLQKMRLCIWKSTVSHAPAVFTPNALRHSHSPYCCTSPLQVILIVGAMQMGMAAYGFQAPNMSKVIGAMLIGIAGTTLCHH